jgi:asparagine synthase (glutamine-hydrolysing)
VTCSEEQPILKILSVMNRAIIHRGPDDEGYFEQANAGIAMRRLSIIDLETGHQPMYSADKRLAIVFNGEVYNFRELKDKFLRDYSFSTRSDTEVVLNLYHKIGIQCLEHIRGIFAFAIYDIPKKELFVARDQMGVKPMYYYSDNNVFLFSSDILSFHPLPFLDLSINQSCLGDYIRFGYIPQPTTIFNRVHSLHPGHYAFINVNAKVSITQYYNLSERVNRDIKPDLTFCQERLGSYIHESVTEQLVSDVPLGVFLSGGIDSSVITSEMASVSTDRVSTFTIGFQGASNKRDIELSAMLSSILRTIHYEKIVKPNIDEVLDKIIDSMGEPFAITSAIPIYINSTVAREKVKVVLSGDGADEVFGGYNRYQRFFRYKNIEWLRYLPLKQINDLVRSITSIVHSNNLNKAYRLWLDPFLSFFSQSDNFQKYLQIIGATNDKIIDDLMNNDVSRSFPPSIYAREFTLIAEKNGLNLNSLMMFDVQTSLVDEMLTKVDFASMLASLEVRVPFLDHRLVEFGLSLPEEFKVKQSINKYILKETYRDCLPSEIVNTAKRGFNLPLDNWIRYHWKESFKAMFNNPILDEIGFNRGSIQSKFNSYLNGYPLSGKIFFYIYILARWYEKLKITKSRNEF